MGEKPWLTLTRSSPRAILAKCGALFVLLAGRPGDPDYEEVLSSLQNSMAEAGGSFSFTGRLDENRRGAYRAISSGVTLGCGSKVGF